MRDCKTRRSTTFFPAVNDSGASRSYTEIAEHELRSHESGVYCIHCGQTEASFATWRVALTGEEN